MLGKGKKEIFDERRLTQGMIRVPLGAARRRVTALDWPAERDSPGGKIAVAMGAAYEAAKAGGKHEGMLRIYRELPDNLIEKAIRSLAARAAEHKAWIAEPTLKLGAGVSAEKGERLVRNKWPKEVRGFEEEIDVLQGILQERRQERRR